jgi:lipid-binding SYLF domain-containing protein
MNITKNRTRVYFFAAAFALVGTTGCGSKESAKATAEESAKGFSSEVAKIADEGDRGKVTAALEEFYASEQVKPFFDRSYGFAIFPTIGKGGLGIGGAHGAGWVFRKGNLTGITKMTQVTIGFQAGGQAFKQIIFFENQAAYDNFTSGNFEFGAQATAVAITAGATASADTAGGSSAGAGSAQSKSNYSGGMAIFTHATGGLMYEASLGGQKFSFNEL